jgi:hypothetical protein
MSTEISEITQTVRQLQAEFEDLAVGGLRAAGPDRLPVLEALREELERVGASHLAGRLEALTDAIRADDRRSSAALMRAQSSLRLFERILTLRTTATRLNALTAVESVDQGETTP